MRKTDLIRRNEKLIQRIAMLENILCPAEQHDWHEVDHWYEPDGEDLFSVEVRSCSEFVCRRCLKRKVVKSR